MEAAFVDIGLEKNGFLHVDEIVTPDGQTHRRGRGRGGGPRISDLLKAGQEVVVQVTKDPIGTKGARLSMEVSIPGPLSRVRAGRRRRRRLPPAARLRARAAAQARLGAEAQGRGADHPHRRARRAQERHGARAAVPVPAPRGARRAASRSRRRPSMVFQEADLPIRVVRDVFSREFERAVIDDEKQHHRVTSFFKRTAPGAGGPRRAVQGRGAAVRAARAWRTCSTRRSRAGWTCPTAAT